MDFTRDPIIESVVTPREGFKLVLRNSKVTGQEEYFVDAIEMVSFGRNFFLRSRERPKPFLLPATDYEILEVRETRSVLKKVPVEGVTRNISKKRPEKKEVLEEIKEEEQQIPRNEKKRERRRSGKRKHLHEEAVKDEVQSAVSSSAEPTASKEIAPPPRRSLLPPPSTLISETIERYKGDKLFKEVFISGEEVPLEAQTQPEEFPLILEANQQSNFEEDLPSL